MKKAFAVAALLAASLPAIATAQQRPVLEVGTSVGLTVTRSDGGNRSTTIFGIPGGGTDTYPGVTAGSLYLAVFPAERFFLEPEFALLVVGSQGHTYSGLSLLGWLSFAPAGVTADAPYLGVAPAFHRLGGDNGSASQSGIAGRAGYRTIVRESLALRFEAGFQHWLDNDDVLGHDVFMFRVGIGAVLKPAT